MKQISNGYYKIESKEELLYIGISNKQALVIDLKNKSIIIATANRNTYLKKLNNSNYTNISYYTFYEVYKDMLKLTDEFLGVRNLLIEPEELSTRVDVDSFGRPYIIR